MPNASVSHGAGGELVINISVSANTVLNMCIDIAV